MIYERSLIWLISTNFFFFFLVMCVVQGNWRRLFSSDVFSLPSIEEPSENNWCASVFVHLFNWICFLFLFIEWRLEVLFFVIDETDGEKRMFNWLNLQVSRWISYVIHFFSSNDQSANEWILFTPYVRECVRMIEM